MRPTRLAMGVLVCSLAPACSLDLSGREVGGGDDKGGSDSDTGTESAEGKLSSNGLVLDFEAMALLNASPIGRWQNDTEAVADSGSLEQFLAHPAGAEHLGYLATCALDRGTALVAGGDRFEGLFGLGAEWVEEGCGESCQRWVSACVLAHANAYGLPVTLSLRGDHPGLVWDADIETEFAVQEAAFYGNLFEIASGARRLYACYGRMLMDTDGDQTITIPFGYLQVRVCGYSSCGLENMGQCVNPPISNACAVDAGETGGYADCNGAAIDGGAPEVYAETVTTYLATLPSSE